MDIHLNEIHYYFIVIQFVTNVIHIEAFVYTVERNKFRIIL